MERFKEFFCSYARYFAAGLVLAALPIIVFTAKTDTVFSKSSGKLVIPYMRIGNEVYYAGLNLVDAKTCCSGLHLVRWSIPRLPARLPRQEM